MSYNSRLMECLVTELIKLADAYEQKDFKRHCIEMIKDGIAISNIAFFYGWAKSNVIQRCCIN